MFIASRKVLEWSHILVMITLELLSARQYGNSALYYACKFNNSKIFTMLVNYGAEVDTKNKVAVSAIFIAFAVQWFLTV